MQLEAAMALHRIVLDLRNHADMALIVAACGPGVLEVHGRYRAGMLADEPAYIARGRLHATEYLRDARGDFVICGDDLVHRRMARKIPGAALRAWRRTRCVSASA